VKLYQTKNHYKAKETKNRMKRQPTGRENLLRILQFNSKKQTTQLKSGQRKLTEVFQTRHTNGQQVHEKVCNITNHHRNANQTQNVITS